MAGEAQADLDEALPALNAAMDSIKALNKNDITEIKSFPKPPPLVQVCRARVGGCRLLPGRPAATPPLPVARQDGLLSYEMEQQVYEHV
jgi:hypothetical protein